MKERLKLFACNSAGFMIPIIAIVFCLVYENEFSPDFKFLWLNLLLPFYLFFIDSFVIKDNKRNELFGFINSLLIMVASCAVCIFFVHIRYSAFYISGNIFIDFEMRFFRYKELIFMLLLSIVIFLMMTFVRTLRQNMRNSKSKSVRLNVVALTVTIAFAVALLLNHFGVFSLNDKNQCENLCRNMLYEILETNGEYAKCESSLKENISEHLYKSIYDNYTDQGNLNYREKYKFDCVKTELISNKAKVSYVYSYKQTDEKSGKLLFGSAADVYNPNVMTMEKTDNKWIVTGNHIED